MTLSALRGWLLGSARRQATARALMRIVCLTLLVPFSLVFLYASCLVHHRDVWAVQVKRMDKRGAGTFLVARQQDSSSRLFAHPVNTRVTYLRLVGPASDDDEEDDKLQHIDQAPPRDYQAGAAVLTASLQRHEAFVVTLENMGADASAHNNNTNASQEVQQHRICVQLGKSSSSSSSSSAAKFCQNRAIKGLSSSVAAEKWLLLASSRGKFLPPADCTDCKAQWVTLSRPGWLSGTLQPLEALWHQLSFASWSFRSVGASSSLPFRRNPNKSASSSPPSGEEASSADLWRVVARPAFVLLASLQAVLAFVYWNQKAPVMHVALHVESIHAHNQVWRVLTGATAHYDLWHIGLNLSAFYQLSLHLEGFYSSLEYLGLNLSLIVLVGAVWYGLQLVCVPSERRHVPTIGYSGVLFALSMLHVLQQPVGTQTCPIPLLEQACFATFALPLGLKLGVTPFVQLAVAQLILPRASWTGHLAGILVGWAFAWGLVPFLAFPFVWWPLLHLIYLKWFWSPANESSGGSSRGIPMRLVSMRYLLTSPTVWMHGLALVAPVLGSSMAAGPLTLSFAIWIVFDCLVDLSEQHISVLRGHAVATVLNLVALSMTFGMQAATAASMMRQPIILVQVVQWILLLAGFWRSVSALQRHTPVGGIFNVMLRPMLPPTDGGTDEELSLPSTIPRTPATPSFPGAGRTLGGATRKHKKNWHAGPTSSASSRHIV